MPFQVEDHGIPVSSNIPFLIMSDVVWIKLSFGTRVLEITAATKYAVKTDGFSERGKECFRATHFTLENLRFALSGTRSKTAPEDVLSLSYTWSSHKRQTEYPSGGVYERTQDEAWRVWVWINNYRESKCPPPAKKKKVV